MLPETPPVSNPPPAEPRNRWPGAVALVLVVAILVGAGVFIFREVVRAPAAIVQKTGEMIDKGGAQLRSVAEAFNKGTVKTEFLSQATELAGTSRFQFATLKQSESFRREETGSTAWGWIPLPKVVVLAVAPVEYTYYLDFEGPWRFERAGDTIIVFAPPIETNSPALDVSALSFYTLEGSLWRQEAVVREKLRQSLTDSLKERAIKNAELVHEIGRRKLEGFVQKWLVEKFSDGRQFHVKVVFPAEQPTESDQKAL